MEKYMSIIKAMVNQINSAGNYAAGFSKYLNDFMVPYLLATNYFSNAETEKIAKTTPLDFIEAEVTPFPKGHVAIATSWSNPTSACALHTCVGNENYRSPVRFQLDLDESISEA